MGCVSSPSLLAARTTGTIGIDAASSFSLADPSAKAAFLSLATATATVTLTPTHKLPAGPAKALKQASEVHAIGEMIWISSPAAGALVQAPVVETAEQRRRAHDAHLARAHAMYIVFAARFAERRTVWKPSCRGVFLCCPS